ncbi:hypothetical protein ACIRO3_29785 [Streptomyces sp. NPDC102278]|uniref:hypothetical protein n=1 Tax=Streptomyces sp. NPDC102278 TaxID=3366152 RepID=UPI00381F5914
MTDDDRPTATRTALVKAGLAAAGVAFFVLALALPARWAYAPAAILLAASVLVGRRPGRRS